MKNSNPNFDINDRSLVPSEKDWDGPYDPIEAQCAQEKFGGKTVAEVMPFILSAGVGASLYFIDMPPIPFRYYIKAWVELLKPPRLDELDDLEASNTAMYFLVIVRLDLKTKPNRILPVMKDLVPLIEAIGTDPSRYGFDFEEDEIASSAMPTVPIKQQITEILELLDKVTSEQK